MQPKGFIPVFEDKKTLVEIDIRGRFLMMACDVEWTMLHIMMHCAPDTMNQIRKFNSEDMKMHNKIQCTISDLKKFKPHYYEEYKEELDQLMEFKTVRNDVSHHKLKISDDFKEFDFLFITNDENDTEKLFYKRYTIEYLKDFLKRFAAVEVRLAELVQKLQTDLNLKDGNH